jgi:hypothetical protein
MAMRHPRGNLSGCRRYAHADECATHTRTNARGVQRAGWPPLTSKDSAKIAESIRYRAPYVCLGSRERRLLDVRGTPIPNCIAAGVGPGNGVHGGARRKTRDGWQCAWWRDLGVAAPRGRQKAAARGNELAALQLSLADDAAPRPDAATAEGYETAQKLKATVWSIASKFALAQTEADGVRCADTDDGGSSSPDERPSSANHSNTTRRKKPEMAFDTDFAQRLTARFRDGTPDDKYKQKPVVTRREIVAGLYGDIMAQRSAGYSLEGIAAYFGSLGAPIKVSTLKSYLLRCGKRPSPGQKTGAGQTRKRARATTIGTPRPRQSSVRRGGGPSRLPRTDTDTTSATVMAQPPQAGADSTREAPPAESKERAAASTMSAAPVRSELTPSTTADDVGATAYDSDAGAAASAPPPAVADSGDDGAPDSGTRASANAEAQVGSAGTAPVTQRDLHTAAAVVPVTGIETSPRRMWRRTRWQTRENPPSSAAQRRQRSKPEQHAHP